MRIDKITFQNFKGFERFDQRLDQRFTLIIGNNGAGKTTILDSLSIAFGSFLLGIPVSKARHISHSEVHEQVRDYDGALDFNLAYPVFVEAEGTLDVEVTRHPQTLTWKRVLSSKKGRTNTKDATSLKDKSADLFTKIKEGQDTTLPLLSYYGTGRLWLLPKNRAPNEKISRFDAYDNSHEPQVSAKDLLAWLEKERLLELETEKPSLRLKAWKDAVEGCFDEPIRISFSPSRKRLEISFIQKEKTVSYENLSHGQRTILAMVGDIAFKSIILNPHLRDDAVCNTAGIVLIDEIDLHLHPRWQKKIIPALLKAFPKIQFIATTHSPFVIQSLHEGQVLNLDEMELDGEVYDLSIHKIASEIQNVSMPEHSDRYINSLNLAEKVLQSVEHNSPLDENPHTQSEIEDLMREVEAINDPALAAFLKVKIAAARGHEK